MILTIDVLDTVLNTVIQSRLCYTYMYFTFRYIRGVTGTSATFIIQPSVITADRQSYSIYGIVDKACIRYNK